MQQRETLRVRLERSGVLEHAAWQAPERVQSGVLPFAHFPQQPLKLLPVAGVAGQIARLQRVGYDVIQLVPLAVVVLVQGLEPPGGPLVAGPVQQVLEARGQVEVLVDGERGQVGEVFDEGKLCGPRRPHRVVHCDLVQAVAAERDVAWCNNM